MKARETEEFILGALLGSAIGAAAALILTPFSGEGLRRKIAGRWEPAPIAIKRKRSMRAAPKSKQLHSSTAHTAAKAAAQKRSPPKRHSGKEGPSQVKQ
jgi:gas vesicle protein